jgi:arylsulfatase A-like enzyme
VTLRSLVPRWLLVLAGLAACGRAPSAGPLNVVLVTIDTLRADHLGFHGHARPTSPALDALAADAVVFDNASATCPATAPSVASLLSGLHRAAHGVRGNGGELPPSVQTLAEILKAHGYRTGAAVANPVLEAALGFAQGFDDFSLPPGLVRTGPGMLGGAPVVAEAARLLDAPSGEAPFFLWLHFMDPHGPYFPPADYRDRFSAADYVWPGDEALPIAEGNYGLHLIPRYQAVRKSRSPADYRARYDAEIRYTDDHVQAVIDLLRARGLWDRTLLVLTADHGESLGEHDYYFQHGALAYEDSLHVPLVVRAPGRLPRGRRVSQTVSLIDVAPTVLALLGLPAGEAMEGQSLLPLLAGPAVDRPAFAQTPYGDGLVALRRGAHKYIFIPLWLRPDTEGPAADAPAAPAAAREELFDLRRDPGETRNLAATHADLLHELRGETERWLATQQARKEQGVTVAPGLEFRPLADPALERQLRALGYLD